MEFEKLYHTHYPELYRFAYKLCLSDAESKDMVQDTFTKLFKELKSNAKFENTRAWLYKVCLNLWRNKFNQEKNREQLLEGSQQVEITSSTPEKSFIEKEKRQLIFDTMNRLPEKDRQILYLYHEGLSYNEMAEVLDMNPLSVGKTLARSIQKFKLQLKKEHYELFE